MKPNDKQWFKDCDALVKLLIEKLSADEFVELFRLIAADPPGGPLWDRLAAKAMELKPAVFADKNDETNEEEDFPDLKE
jgi:hypothetical protein